MVEQFRPRGLEHLHRNRGQHQSHQPLEGAHRALAEQPLQAIGGQQHQRRDDHGAAQRGGPYTELVRIARPHQHYCRERGRTGDGRYRQRYDEGFGTDRVAEDAFRMREHHSQRDQKQNHSARDRQRGFGQVHQVQKGMTAEQKHQQYRVGDQTLAQHHAHSVGSRHRLKGAHDQRHVAEGIDHQDQQDGGREQF